MIGGLGCMFEICNILIKLVCKQGLFKLIGFTLKLRNAENKSQENRDEVVENLRTKIQLLQAKVDDAEYKNQMSSRQMRRGTIKALSSS